MGLQFLLCIGHTARKSTRRQQACFTSCQHRSCCLLQIDSDARTAAEVRAVFRDAGEMRPAVVLLRHFEALSGDRAVWV